MVKSFWLSLRLRNAYRVNSIIYSLKQLPLIKKILPDRLYKNKGIKILGNIISIFLEILNIFLGKLLYLWLMIFSFLSVYETKSNETFLHLFFFLTLAGALLNTYMFNPTKDKYYAMILMNMDARKYTLSNYIYAMVKTFLGFLPFTLLFSFLVGVPLWLSIILPLLVCAAKVNMAAINLRKYRQERKVINENNPPKSYWLLVLVLLLCAYGLPFLKITITETIFLVLLIIILGVSILAWWQIWNFSYFRKIYKELLANNSIYIKNVNVKTEVAKASSLKNIQYNEKFTSNKSGFAYFHDLFVKRHRKILTLAIKKQAIVLLFLFGLAVIALLINKNLHQEINNLLLTYLPYFVFIMYLLNRGQTVTNAMFLNCDHSMLTYRFYRTPKVILGIFKERLKTLIFLNLIPASIIGIALPVLLFMTGGTTNPLNYVVLFVSIISMSIFFSVHYLVMYYLLQPYNVETEMKSSTYSVVQFLTYFVCYAMIDLHLPTLYFGACLILFCVLYSFLSLFIAYRLAPKTFKLRR